MARARTRRVEEVKRRLLDRLRDGGYRPGDRFLSAREVAARFAVSYQTADRLIRELCGEGHLQRVRASGTFVPKHAPALVGAQLFFHPRGRAEGSLGDHLRRLLLSQLQRAEVPCTTTWTGSSKTILADHFPVVWEQPDVLRECAAQRRHALVFGDELPPGLDATDLDQLAADDYAGGTQAAQLLRQQTGQQRGFAVLAGPQHDRRSQQRADGFCSEVAARVVMAAGNMLEDGLAVAEEVLGAGAVGIFCCDDRLAEAVLIAARELGVACPPLVGFGDSPLAASLELTTIGIPWQEMAAAAAAVIERRLAGDPSPAARQVFTPRPVLRRL